MPNNNVATIYEVPNGYRWMFKSKAFTMVSNTEFTAKHSCKRSLERFLTKHSFDYWDITFKEGSTRRSTFTV